MFAKFSVKQQFKRRRVAMMTSHYRASEWIDE
jgi:hypothetical protein